MCKVVLSDRFQKVVDASDGPKVVLSKKLKKALMKGKKAKK